MWWGWAKSFAVRKVSFNMVSVLVVGIVLLSEVFDLEGIR